MNEIMTSVCSPMNKERACASADVYVYNL